MARRFRDPFSQVAICNPSDPVAKLLRQRRGRRRGARASIVAGHRRSGAGTARGLSHLK
jgi:hypothetical protein